MGVVEGSEAPFGRGGVATSTSQLGSRGKLYDFGQKIGVKTHFKVLINIVMDCFFRACYIEIVCFGCYR